jgi:hypothetical protein
VTTVTDVASAAHSHPRASLLERVAALVIRIRSTAGEGLEVTVARAVDEAFASIAREYRR